MRMLIHSTLLNERKIPAIKTIKAVTYCILKFFSLRRQSFKPWKANEKDFKTLMILLIFKVEALGQKPESTSCIALQASKISSSEIISGGTIRKHSGAKRNQSEKTPLFKSAFITFLF